MTRATPQPVPQVDERAVSAGTTARFALLVVLILLTSSLMTLRVVITAQPGNDLTGCMLAAGMDLEHVTDADILTSRVLQWVPFDDCTSRHALSPPWWVLLVWPVVLLALAALIFFCLPWWKARRRAVPLQAVDGDGEIRRALEDLASVAALPRLPRVVVEPAATASTGALVFGRNRRPVMCLHGGLIARRLSDPEGFRTVVLHEFAHIHNRDLTVTYTTVALWRVFLVSTLPPFLTWTAAVFVHASRETGLGPAQWTIASRGLAVVLLLAVLVHLSRADVLRSREVYADRTAARWGADFRDRQVTEVTNPPRSRTRRAAASFAQLFRTHPSWTVRREALSDPVLLFRLSAFPMFLTGSAAALINHHLTSAFQQYLRASTLCTAQISTLAAAALVATVTGVPLWRSAVHTVVTGRRTSSPVRAGLWLGAGMAFGALVAGQGTLNQWVGGRPLILLALVPGGVVFAWWTEQCARLWAANRRGQSLRPVIVLVLAASCLALASWLNWWQGSGSVLTSGWWYSPEKLQTWLAQAYPGPVGDHRTAVTAIALTTPVILSLTEPPFVALAVAALYVAPLLFWSTRRRGPEESGAGAATGSTTGCEARVPRLRRALLPGVGGGALSCLAVVAVVWGLENGETPPVPRGSLPGILLLAWSFAVLMAAAVLTALVTALLTRGHRLILTFVATLTAALLGLLGLAALLSLDGCLAGLNTFEATCNWRPELFVTWNDFHVVVGAVLVLAALTAVLVSALSSAGARMFRAQRPAATRPSGAARGRATTARRACVSVLCALALLFTAAETAYQQRRTANLPEAAAMQALAQQVAPDSPSGTRVTARMKARQFDAWSDLGGRDLMDRAASGKGRFENVVRTARQRADLDHLRELRPVCADFARTARDADAWFRVPDIRGQKSWQSFAPLLRKAYAACDRALTRLEAGLREQAVADFTTSFQGVSLADNISGMMRLHKTMIRYNAEYFPDATCRPQGTLRC